MKAVDRLRVLRNATKSLHKIFQLEQRILAMEHDLPAGILTAGCGEYDKITYQLESSQLGHTQLARNHKTSCQLAESQPAGRSVNNR